MKKHKSNENEMESKLTDNDCAISSSGTSSGLKAAGVSHEHDWFNGNRVTITSPFAKHSIHLLFKLKKFN
jgi:hypothetical protein